MHNSKQPRIPSQAQIDANRRNAQKSTGPRSTAGKAASSRNRLLHGLRAQKHLILEEDPDDFLDLLADLQDRFQPVGDGEDRLVMRIASDQWRLDRTLDIEAGTYRESLQFVAEEDSLRQRKSDLQTEEHLRDPESTPPPPPLPEPYDRLARAFGFDVDSNQCLAHLARYETAIERSIERNLRLLKIYQAARLASGPRAESQPDQPDQPVEDLNPPVQTAVNPSESINCHSNPIDQRPVRFSAVAIAFTLLSFLRAVPRYWPAFRPKAYPALL